MKLVQMTAVTALFLNLAMAQAARHPKIHVVVTGLTAINTENAVYNSVGGDPSTSPLDLNVKPFETDCPISSASTVVSPDNRSGGNYDVIATCKGDGVNIPASSIIAIHWGGYLTEEEATEGKEHLLRSRVSECVEGGYYVDKATRNAVMYCHHE